MKAQLLLISIFLGLAGISACAGQKVSIRRNAPFTL